MTAFLEKVFHIQERNTTVSKELIGGLTTFLAMFYILPVNGFMFEGVSLDGTNMVSVGAIFAATAIAAGITTIIMGLYANFPVALAPGMGVNAFVSYTVCRYVFSFTYAEALALTFVAGVIFIIISITPLRTWILNAIPKNLKLAIGAGIGFFIGFIGLKNAGIVVANAGTYIGLGDFTSLPVLMALIGIILVLVLCNLPWKKVSQFGVIISLLVMGVACATMGQLGVADMPKFVTDNSSSVADLGTTFAVCFKSGFTAFTHPEAYAILFALLFVDFFDTAGTLVAVGEQAGFIDKDGQIIGAKRALLTDSIGTCIGATCGVTTVTSFVESTTGISAGARTGLASVVTGVLFLLSLLIYPALGMFSSVTLESGLTVSPVTSLALVYVGTCMFKQLKDIEWDNAISTTAGFITIIIMTLAYSISDGIAWGIVVYTLLSLTSKNYKKISPLMYVLSGLFIVYYIVKAIVF